MTETRTPPVAGASPPDDAEEARRQAEALRLPFEPLEHLPEDAGLWSEVPLEVMVRFVCVPLGRSGGRLVLAFGGFSEDRKSVV